MAKKKATTKKKNKKTSPKPKKKSANNRKVVKKAAAARSIARKTARKKSTAPKKIAASKTKSTAKSAAKKTQTVARNQTAPPKQTRRAQHLADEDFSSMESRTRSAGQSGDLQGLSDVDEADSESVDELVEEGNAFEAGVVAGVEEADDSEGREVHTHEVPEDDVPGEYLDEE
jgi:hypothetical protein